MTSSLNFKDVELELIGGNSKQVSVIVPSGLKILNVSASCGCTGHRYDDSYLYLTISTKPVKQVVAAHKYNLGIKSYQKNINITVRTDMGIKSFMLKLTIKEDENTN